MDNPHLEIPLEIQTEVWPQRDSSASIAVNYVPAQVTDGFAEHLAHALRDRLRNVDHHVRELRRIDRPGHARAPQAHEENQP